MRSKRGAGVDVLRDTRIEAEEEDEEEREEDEEGAEDDELVRSIKTVDTQEARRSAVHASSRRAPRSHSSGVEEDTAATRIREAQWDSPGAPRIQG